MITTAESPMARLLRPFLWLHRRLLPNAAWAGWTPYLWLIYLGFFFVQWPGMPPWDAVKWTFSILAALIFLVLYFRSYNCTQRELRRILSGISVLGYVFISYTGTGHTFIVYACALTAHYGNLRKSLTATALILAGFMAESITLYYTPYTPYAHSVWFWLPTLVISGVIGAANAWFADDEAKRRVIVQSQEEIRRLAATAERERIARDLHDLLGHTLTLITVKAELAARLAERDVAAAASEVRELERISREALRLVREAVGGYRNVGLAGELANARVALSAAKVELSTEVPLQGCPATHDNLFALVLREAVTNIVRHARASRCNVKLVFSARTAVLTIEDDGRGGSFREGNGLRGMRERLAAVDGALDIESGPRGTRLMASLQLAGPAEEPGPETLAWPGILKNKPSDV